MDPNGSVLPSAYLLNSFGFVALGNRTSKRLEVTFDGKTWPLPPYPEMVLVPPQVAEWACRQHRRMGTENPYDALDVEYLVYVKDADGKVKWGLHDTPIEQSDAVESIDRSLLPPDVQDVRMMNFGRRSPGNTSLPPAEPPAVHGGTSAFFDGRDS